MVWGRVAGGDDADHHAGLLIVDALHGQGENARGEHQGWARSHDRHPADQLGFAFEAEHKGKRVSLDLGLMPGVEWSVAWE